MDSWKKNRKELKLELLMASIYNWEQLGKAWKVNVFFPKEVLNLSFSFDDNENEFQSSWIELINYMGPNIVIGCYYRHRKNSSNYKLLEQLKITLTKLKNRNTHIFVSGREISFGKCPTVVWSATQTAFTLKKSNSFPLSWSYTKVSFSSACQNFL